MKEKKQFIVLTVLFVMLAFVSCGGGPSGPVDENSSTQTRIFVDSAGREVEIPQEVNAIAPSGPLAQIVLYTACPDKLAGIATDFNDEAKLLIDEKYWGLTKFGQFYGKNASLNLEALIAAAPDVIVDIGEVKENVKEDMDGLQEQLNIPVIFIEATLDTMDQTYEKIGELTGEGVQTEALAVYCKEVLGKAETIKQKLKEEEKVTVYQALGAAGLHTDARGSFQGQVLDKVGAINVADVEIVSSGAGSEVSLEQVIAWNPDVIVVETERVYELITSDDAWSVLDAVKNGRVYKYPTAPYSALNNPPSVNRLMGVLWLGNLIYPEQYDVDIAVELQHFYQLFYHVELDDGQTEALLGLEKLVAE